MNITTIARSEFERLLSHDVAVETLAQVAWFSNVAGNLLGTIAQGAKGTTWSYVILKRGKDGSFQIQKVMNNFSSYKTAKADLLISMAEMTVNEPDLSFPFTAAA